MRVLIVDDEPSIRQLLASWISSAGGTAFEAATAEEGLHAVEREGAPAVALCDLRLPGHDGIWLAEQLRASHPETSVVVTTAVHEFDAAVQSLRAGAVDYLNKPYTRERFLQALQQAIVVHMSRRSLAAMQTELDERRSQISDALAEIEVNTKGSLEAMLAMLNTRDPASYEHAHRVAKLAVDLAMALEIGEPQLSDIERAALLHDLGRLAMPDRLLRPGPATLSADDRARLRSFPLHGYALLGNVPFLASASSIAVAAHERADGSGFPHGLDGDRIPLGARIVGVADAYEELVSAHPGTSPARALEVLQTERAAQFDSQVLEVLARLQPGLSPSERALHRV